MGRAVSCDNRHVFWRKKEPAKKPTYREQRAYVAKTIKDFMNGTGGPWDWDDFISFPTGFTELDAVQRFCLRLPIDYPPDEKTGGWCNAQGFDALRRKLEELETENREAGP